MGALSTFSSYTIPPIPPAIFVDSRKKTQTYCYEWSFLRYFNNQGQLITSFLASGRGWGEECFESGTRTSKALIFPRGGLFALDLISDSNRPAQWRWQENTQTLICWTYVWFAFCPRRWITLIPAAWKVEWVAAQGASDYGRRPAHHCMGSLGNRARLFIKVVRGVWSKRAEVEQRLAVQLRDYGD